MHAAEEIVMNHLEDQVHHLKKKNSFLEIWLLLQAKEISTMRIQKYQRHCGVKMRTPAGLGGKGVQLESINTEPRGGSN